MSQIMDATWKISSNKGCHQFTVIIYWIITTAAPKNVMQYELHQLSLRFHFISAFKHLSNLLFF